MELDDIIRGFEDIYNLKSKIESCLEFHQDFYRMDVSKRQLIINNPRSHFQENLFNLLENVNLEIKYLAVKMIESLDQRGVKFVRETLKNLKNDEKCKFFYNILIGGYFAEIYFGNKTLELLENLISQLEEETSYNIIDHVSTLFMKHWENLNFNSSFLYNSYFFETLRYLPTFEKKKLLQILKENKDELLFLHLYVSELYHEKIFPLTTNDFFNLFEEVDLDDFTSRVMEYMNIAEESVENDKILRAFGELGEFGIRMLLRLSSGKYEYMEYESFDYVFDKLAEENLDLIKIEVIDFIINYSYEKVKDIFSLNIIRYLDDKDLFQILSNKNANLMEKFNKAVEDGYTHPYLFEEWFSRIRELSNFKINDDIPIKVKKTCKIKGKVVTCIDEYVLIKITTGQYTWFPTSRIRSRIYYNLKDTEQEFRIESWILEKNNIAFD